MMRSRHPRAIGALALLSGLLSGCSGLFEQAPLEFYTLSPSPAVAKATASGGPVFAVAPVRVPQYLSQRSIVTRSGPTQLRLAENDVWAAPLSDTIGSVISENISTMIPSDRVVELPVSAAVPVDYEVRVEIVSFERQPDGAVDLTARWTVFGEGGQRLIAMERTSFRASEVAADYPSITTAMSTLLAELSRDIAAALRSATLPAPLS
jgi:uncharacterized lipoprotein YmbA